MNRTTLKFLSVAAWLLATTLVFLSGDASSLAHSAVVPVSAEQAGAPQAPSERVIYLN